MCHPDRPRRPRSAANRRSIGLPPTCRGTGRRPSRETPADASAERRTTAVWGGSALCIPVPPPGDGVAPQVPPDAERECHWRRASARVGCEHVVAGIRDGLHPRGSMAQHRPPGLLLRCTGAASQGAAPFFTPGAAPSSRKGRLLFTQGAAPLHARGGSPSRKGRPVPREPPSQLASSSSCQRGREALDRTHRPSARYATLLGRTGPSAHIEAVSRTLRSGCKSSRKGGPPSHDHP